MLNAGRSIDSSSENLSGKEEEERRPGSRFPLSLPINTPLLIRAAWSCSNSFFNPRGEMLFRKPLCDDTFPYFFLSLSFSLEKILPSLSSFTCQIDRLVKLSRERERERERKRASIEETIIISVSGSGWHLNSQLSIVTRVNRGWWGKFNSCEVTSISCFDNLSFKI